MNWYLVATLQGMVGLFAIGDGEPLAGFIILFCAGISLMCERQEAEHEKAE